MVKNSAQIIKEYLESTYDIPFDVNRTDNYMDSWYDIKPKNSDKELFNVNVKFKNNIRIIIEVTPEKYAAFSIQDMSNASAEKKQLFAQYGKQLILRKAKIEFFINDTFCDVTNPESWPDKWTNYRMRVSRSPIFAEDEDFNEVEITSSWVTVIVGMFLSLLNVISIEENEYLEGGLKRVETNRYERNPINRELCLAANGYSCKICGFNFESSYGSIGRHFIHVHHIVPVSENTEAYLIDPINDMIPVCPNCHAMLHKSNPPLLPRDLEELIKEAKKTTSEQ